jgi:hypothetical protein
MAYPNVIVKNSEVTRPIAVTRMELINGRISEPLEIRVVYAPKYILLGNSRNPVDVITTVSESDIDIIFRKGIIIDRQNRVKNI